MKISLDWKLEQSCQRMQDYSPVTALSQEKDKLATEN